MTPEQLGLMILAASEVPNFLAGMLPSLFTIKTFSDDPEKVKALRQGEVIGGAMALAVGAGASLVSRSWAPLVACGTVLGAMIYAYESAIRNPISKPIDMEDYVRDNERLQERYFSGGRGSGAEDTGFLPSTDVVTPPRDAVGDTAYAAERR